jgi:hypothetical protein
VNISVVYPTNPAQTANPPTLDVVYPLISPAQIALINKSHPLNAQLPDPLPGSPDQLPAIALVPEENEQAVATARINLNMGNTPRSSMLYKPFQPNFEKMLRSYSDYNASLTATFGDGIQFYGFYMDDTNVNQMFVIPEGCIGNHILVLNC